ncbi:thiopurine S-methyltransferase [Ixodes scapularis]|uniref:thiopurine S-methyltransferase n=1 Tax=Ixodes scapularis TaxID=6945 RepID=UPI001A9E2A46|nr:thiopurine S-methyltransferase [Ixodes scapularis]
MSPLERWTNHWDTGSIPWQLDHLFPLLAKHQDVILAGKQDAQVYVPMSGKAPELKWFYDKGHRVVGVEFVESAARGSLVEIGLPLEEAECPVLKWKIFQTPDKRFRIFVCNVLDFNKSCAGEMDIVWDIGALSSIKESDRDRYVAVMKSLLAPNFSYGLWSVVYDGQISRGEGIKMRLVDKDAPKTLDFCTSPVTSHLWHLTE